MPPTDVRQVELVLHQVDTLPTLSPVATRLLSIGSPEDADLDEVVTLIESDPALTSKILSLCRRADRGLGQSVSTVRKAVIMLGLEAVQGAVLSVCVYELLDQAGRELDEKDPRPIAFDRCGFWKHSVAVACAADLIASAHPHHGVRPEEAFVAGLLHDVGKLVMELVLPHAYAKVIELSEHRQCDSAGVERSLVGIDHHTAGKRVAEKWRLPTELQDVMWLHSQPLASVPGELAHRNVIGVVTVAKALCRTLHLGWAGDFGRVPELPELCAEVGLDYSVVHEIAPRLHEAVTDRCAVLGIDDETSPELLMRSIAQANRQLGRINAILEQRSRTSRTQELVLDAIEFFHASAYAGESVFDVLSEIARSAGRILGDGFFGVVFQPAPEDAWHVLQFSGDGRLLRSQLVEPPPGQASIAELTGSAELSVSALALLPWLTDFLGDATDIRRVKLMPLRAGPRSGPSALLLHDRDPDEVGLRLSQLRALVATWASAFASAARHEQAVRLGEQLADANRELAEAQAKLTESESLVRLGEMTAGAAHEMNNPLTVIAGRSQMLAKQLNNPRDRAAARAIEAAARELTDLITSLHLLADPPQPEPKRTNLLDVLSAAVARAKERSGVPASVQIQAPEGLPPALIDPSFIERAVVELVCNAVEAEPGGSVLVTARIDPVDDRLVITVADAGPGLSPKASRHAFDPFFSEKPAGRQSGLGLARTRRLVELHGGSVGVQSKPGEGAVAAIVLPDWREPSEEARIEQQKAA